MIILCVGKHDDELMEEEKKLELAGRNSGIYKQEVASGTFA